MLGHGRIRQLRINLYMYTIYDVSTFVSPVAENIQNILFVWKLFRESVTLSPPKLLPGRRRVNTLLTLHAPHCHLFHSQFMMHSIKAQK